MAFTAPAVCVAAALLCHPHVFAQVDLKKRLLTTELPAETSSKALLPRQAVQVLVIPEADILQGVALTEAQREAIRKNLKAAPFKMARPELTRPEQEALRLPSGELFQLLGDVVFPQVPMQQTPTAPGLSANTCTDPGVKDEDLVALRQVLSDRLKTRGVDGTKFLSGYPPECSRKQLIYLVNMASFVAKK